MRTWSLHDIGKTFYLNKTFSKRTDQPPVGPEWNIKRIRLPRPGIVKNILLEVLDWSPRACWGWLGNKETFPNTASQVSTVKSSVRLCQFSLYILRLETICTTYINVNLNYPCRYAGGKKALFYFSALRQTLH